MLDTVSNKPLTLASASPRRRELFGYLGLDFQSRAATIKEEVILGETPERAVQRFAQEKAIHVAQQLDSSLSSIVIGADTIVVLDGRVFGKPVNENQAKEMLNDLCGQRHRVYTALSIVKLNPIESRDEIVCTEVFMRRFSNKEMIRYVKSGDPLDKAGAYAIQNYDFRPARELNGCYANVMGLPLCHLTFFLKKFGVSPLEDVPTVCQQRLNITCSIFESALEGKSWTCQ